MTEADWLSATDVRPMLKWLEDAGRTSDRKLRLFACACARFAWGRLAPPRDVAALDLAERYADGRATDEDLASARRVGYCMGIAATLADTAESAAHGILRAAEVPVRPPAAELLRDIYFSPFRPVLAVDPAWFAWSGGTVGQLARAVYDDRAFGRLPLLADALEDAGCVNRELLGHLRGRGPHTRGCWAVDLLLAASSGTDR